MTTPRSPSSRFALSCAGVGLACVILLAVLIVAQPALAESGDGDAPSPWVVECIACPHDFGYLTPQAAQLDSQGVIHVVYGGEALYHAWQTPAGWQVEVADPLAGVGSYAALAIDAGDRLHAVYLDGTAHTLRYAVREAGRWRSEYVDPRTFVDANPFASIAVDPSGQPQIAYYYPGDGDLEYLVRTGTGWQQELVDGEGDVGAFVSLAVDSATRPHLVFVDRTDQQLRYGVKDAGTWTLRTVDSAADSVAGVGLALDAGGNPHLAMAAHSEIAYYAPEVGGWQKEALVNVCTSGDPSLGVWPYACGGGLGLRLDGSSAPHLAYANLYSYSPYSGPTSELRYAERTTGTWRVLRGPTGSNPALVLPPAGQVHLVALDDADLADHVRIPGSNEWHTTVVDMGGYFYGKSSLAVDAQNRPQVSSVSGANLNLFYGLRDAGVWTLSGYQDYWAGSLGALALDPASRPHVVYWSRIRGFTTLHGMIPSLGAWDSDPTFSDLPFLAGYSLDQAIDRAGVAHALVYTERGVVYAKAGNPLVQTVIDSRLAGSIAGSTPAAGLSIAVDGNGTPQVAYADPAARTLRYATIRAGRWVTETVVVENEAVPAGDWFAAIALGPGNRPSILYAFTGQSQGRSAYFWTRINLARFNGTRWEITPVDQPGGEAESEVDVAINADGWVHLAWYDSYETALNYRLIRPDGSALTVVVDRDWDVGQNPSLALDTFGQPHISYVDATHYDLKHAYIPITVTASVYLPTVRK